MSEIKIKRERIGEGDSVPTTSYASREKDILIQKILLDKERVIRRSEDNGKTWKVVEKWQSEEPLGDNLVLCRDLSQFFLDPDNGRLLRTLATRHVIPGVVEHDFANSPGWRTLRNYIQVSPDEGLTWSEPEQVIVKGKEYDEKHWASWITYGRNAAVIHANSHIIKTAEGALLAPFEGMRLFENGDIVNPRADWATRNPDGAIDTLSGCFIGHWREEGRGLDWSEGETVSLPWKYSCDGAEEPSVDYLPDGRLFMVLRARTYPHTGQELPSLHYYSLSLDHGKTWSEPAPLLYEDDSYPYSPATFAAVFRSSKNNRFYMITNLAEEPCINCWPRNKIYIAEINPENCRIIKNSVTLIDEEEHDPQSPSSGRMSNFQWYEDRHTRDIVLYVPHLGCSREATYRYDLELPNRRGERIL